MERQKEMIDNLLNNIRLVLNRCAENNIDEYTLERSLMLSLSELSSAIVNCSVSEYFIAKGLYSIAKSYDKQYKNALKELI